MKLFNTNCKVLRKLKGVSQAVIADSLGIDRSTWTGYETGSSQPKLAGVYEIAEYFNVSIGDLLENDLSKNVHLSKENTNTEKIKKVHLNVLPSVLLKGQKADYNHDLKITLASEPDAEYDKKNRIIPITDISVAAGAGMYNAEHIENVDAIRLPVTFLKKNATYLTVRIKGQSMSPTLQDGGYAVIRLLDRSEWAKMPDERIYVVSDIEGQTTLKRVKNRFKQDFIVLMSDNPDKATYGNFNLQTDEINTIWYMEWYLSAKMPNIHDQYYSRLQQLEDRVEELFKSPKLINPK